MRNKPSLSVWVTPYYDAFQVLTESRTVFMGGIGAIPLTEIAAYLSIMGIEDLDDRVTFIKMIRALDTVYIDHANAKINVAGVRGSGAGPVSKRLPKTRVKRR